MFNNLFSSVKVARVQQVMCLFAHGFAQELLVQRNDVRVLVGLPERFFIVFRVKRLCTRSQQRRISMMQRLTSTTDTPTGAGHDLDGVVLGLAGSDLVHQLAGIS